MDGLRLFGQCEEAAREYSRREHVDVLVICESGSQYLYLDGKEREVPWLAESMPAWPLGEQVSHMEMRPVRVRTGRWSDNVDKFIHSREMAVDELLSLAAPIKRTA